MRGKQPDLNFKSKYLVIFGDVLLVIGAIAIGLDWVLGNRLSEIGFNSIIDTNVIVIAIGICAALLGKALLVIEARLQRLEDRPQK